MNDDLPKRLYAEAEAIRKASVVMQEAAQQIGLLQAEVASYKAALADRMRVALDTHRQTELLQGKLRECQDRLSSLPGSSTSGSPPTS